LSAAKKALQRERDKVPLFAAEVAAEQPTPEGRIAKIDAGFQDWIAETRKLKADQWRKARAILRNLPADIAFSIIARWQYGIYPGDPVFLLGMITCRLRGDPVDPLTEQQIQAWLDGAEPIHGRAGRRPKNPAEVLA
jgi:hypothetical protein